MGIAFRYNSYSLTALCSHKDLPAKCFSRPIPKRCNHCRAEELSMRMSSCTSALRTNLNISLVKMPSAAPIVAATNSASQDDRAMDFRVLDQELTRQEHTKTMPLLVLLRSLELPPQSLSVNTSTVGTFLRSVVS